LIAAAALQALTYDLGEPVGSPDSQWPVVDIPPGLGGDPCAEFRR
jgi:hypothetical protein